MIDIKRPLQLRNKMPVKNVRVSDSGNTLIGKFQNKFLGNRWFHNYWTLAGKSLQQRDFDLVYKEEDGYGK